MDLDGHPPQWRAVEIPHHLLLVAAADHCLSAAYAGRCPGVDPAELAAHRLRERAAWLARGPGQGRDEARHNVAAALGRRPEELDGGVRAGHSGGPLCGCGPGSYGSGETGASTRYGSGDCYDPECQEYWISWPEAVRAAYLATEVALHSAPRIRMGEVEVIDLRALGTLPELPEVLARTGQCALYRMEPSPGARDPRVKIGIIGAGEGTVPGRAPVEEFLGGWAAAQGLVDLYGDPARGYAGGYEEAP
jgi:hypothetical protein